MPTELRAAPQRPPRDTSSVLIVLFVFYLACAMIMIIAPAAPFIDVLVQAIP